MRAGMASLYSRPPAFSLPKFGMATRATRPGMTVTAGMKIFGNAAIRGVRWLALRSLAERARWISAKFVVQYPKDRTKPRPRTIETQFAPIGLVTSPTPVPCQACRPLGPERGLRDLLAERGEAADVAHRDDRERDQPGEDDEELQHLAVDRGAEAAEADVDQHDGGREHDAPDLRQAEQRVEHDGQGVEVDAGDEDGGDREDDRVEDVGAVPEAEPQELRNRSDFGAVVEGHHDDAEEDHRRNGADPVVVHGRDPVLGAVGGHADDLGGAEVGGDESEAGDPRGERAPGEQEVRAGPDGASCEDADAQHDHEVDRQERVVQPSRVQAQHRDPLPSRCSGNVPVNVIVRWRTGSPAAVAAVRWA